MDMNSQGQLEICLLKYFQYIQIPISTVYNKQ